MGVVQFKNSGIKDNFLIKSTNLPKIATFLLGLPGQIQSQFATKEVNSTNTTFKLIYKVTFGLCITASILVAGTEFFGKPITCDAGSAKLNQDLMHDYCWIHGTKHIPEKNKDISDCAYKKGADENKLATINGLFSCWSSTRCYSKFPI